MAFDGKILSPSAMVDQDSYYPRLETGFLSTPDKEQEFIEQFYNRTFTHFNDQANAIFGVR